MRGSILILINHIGGLFVFRKEVVKAIVDNGFSVVISAPNDDSRAEYFVSLGCQIIKSPLNRRGTNPLADIKLLAHYRKLIRTYHPVAVLTYTIKPNVYGGIACRLTKTPQLANITGLGDAIENGGLLQRLSLWMYKRGLAKAKTVFFQNATNQKLFIDNKIVNGETVLLPGSGVNVDYHQTQPYPSEDGSTVFLFIGRLLKDKGIEELFQATEFIKSKYPSTEFRILGDSEGDYKGRLDSLVSKGIINYLGTTTDVRPYFTDVHCSIMPSYHEGMSNVNLESSANGRPVITTDVPGCRETVDDGITGYIVKARDSQDLIAKVECFINLPYDEKKKMGEAAREKVVREFNRDIVVEAYLEAIKSIANV